MSIRWVGDSIMHCDAPRSRSGQLIAMPDQCFPTHGRSPIRLQSDIVSEKFKMQAAYVADSKPSSEERPIILDGVA